MGAAPLVSVIVPVYQVAPVVAEAIASLRAQTLTDFEALVIDDGSTDGSGGAARAAWGEDPRFRLIRQDNRGLSGARNTGIGLARGEWLAFLDSDDGFAPDFLHRLIGAARASGLPWAASAVRLVYPDGGTVAHSARHGSPDPAGMAEATLPLTDAVEVARIFPSAWNKVYRRELFQDLRFPEGTWYEDHEVFWALVARTGAIRHVPEPLYHHRRDRPGQITGADDERVFQQFAVLDRLRPLVATRARAEAGMAQLASRLIHERAQVLVDRTRRARFVQAARDWFARQGLDYTREAGADLSLALAHELRGGTALSVILPLPEGTAPGDPALAAALEALTARLPVLAEVLAIGPGAGAVAGRAGVRSLPGGLPEAAAAARGLCALVLPPGALPLPEGVVALLEAALGPGVDLALGALLTPQGHHDGWMDNRVAPAPRGDAGPSTARLTGAQAVRLYPSAGRMVLRTAVLAGLGPLGVPAWHPLAQAELVLRAAASGGTAALCPQPAVRQPRPAVLAPATAARWARGLALPGQDRLPPGWRALLALRALAPGLPPPRSAGGAAARLSAALALARSGLRAPSGATNADPGASRLLSRLAGLPPAPP